MTISVDPVTRLDDLDPVAWDALTAHGDFYVSSTGLRIYEELYPREAGYLRAAEGGRMVAGLAWYRLDSESRPSPFTRPDRLLARMLEASGNQVAERRTPPCSGTCCPASGQSGSSTFSGRRQMSSRGTLTTSLPGVSR